MSAFLTKAWMQIALFHSTIDSVQMLFFRPCSWQQPAVAKKNESPENCPYCRQCAQCCQTTNWAGKGSNVLCGLPTETQHFLTLFPPFSGSTSLRLLMMQFGKEQKAYFQLMTPPTTPPLGSWQKWAVMQLPRERIKKWVET